MEIYVIIDYLKETLSKGIGSGGGGGRGVNLFFGYI